MAPLSVSVSPPLFPPVPADPCSLEHVAHRVALEPHHCAALCRAASAGPPHRASRLSCALRCRRPRVPAVVGAGRPASRVADCLGRARPVQGVGAGLSEQTPADGQRGLRIFPHQVSLRLRCDRSGHMSNLTSFRTCTLPWSSPRGRYRSSIVGWSEWTLVVEALAALADFGAERPGSGDDPANALGGALGGLANRLEQQPSVGAPTSETGPVALRESYCRRDEASPAGHRFTLPAAPVVFWSLACSSTQVSPTGA